MKRIYIDYETRSAIDLTEVGAWVYSKHPTTHVLSLSYAIDNGECEAFTDDIPQRMRQLFDLVASGGYVFVAHSSFFEMCMTLNCLGLPTKPAHWRCTLAKAAVHGLPLGLENACATLGESVLKDSQGRNVMLRLCNVKNPIKDGELTLLARYNKQDVVLSRVIDQKLKDLPAAEQAVWELDQTINMRGVPLDRKFIRDALKIKDFLDGTLAQRFKLITNGAVGSPTQIAELSKWMAEQGVVTECLTKDRVREILDSWDIPDNVRQALLIRQELGKTSVSKYLAALNTLDTDDRSRGTLQYSAAFTGRWGGREWQPQNLPVGDFDPDAIVEDVAYAAETDDMDWLRLLYGNTFIALSSGIRGIILAPEGYDLIGADYNAIEARVLAWLTEEAALLSLFLHGEDSYKWMAGKIFNVPIGQVTKDQRSIGKTSVLGCGYQMGVSKFCLTNDVSEELGSACVKSYREANRNVVRFWYRINEAAKEAVRTGADITLGKLTFGVRGSFLMCRLPSGRAIRYFRPSVVTVEAPWSTEEDPKYIEALQYYTVKKKTQMVATTTFGGSLTENVCQAIARDIMAYAIVNLEAANYPIVLTVHDEAVSLIPENEGSEEEYSRIMEKLPPWAKGLPLKAEAWRRKRYKK